VLGLPGLAQVAEYNGFDFGAGTPRRRLRSAVPKFVRMGAGGLLARFPPARSRATTAMAKTRARSRRRRVAVMVLAAGRSTRMAGHKMLADANGQPLVVHA